MGTHFKATETFQYTNFSSFNPPGVKRDLTKGKALRLGIENKLFKFTERIRDFEKHLPKRGYPKVFIPKTNK